MNHSSLGKKVYSLLDQSKDHVPVFRNFGEYIQPHVENAMAMRNKPRKPKTIWASDIGKSCIRQLWYEINTPEDKAPLPGPTTFKFLYGNVIEELVLYLLREAGCKVEREQERVELLYKDWTVSGKIDAMVDGVLVDVKSASSFAFAKYKNEGVTPQNDSFGYLWQLGFYRQSIQWPAELGLAGFLFIDKSMGHIAEVYPNYLPSTADINNKLARITYELEAADSALIPPVRGHDHVPEGKAGNMKLGTVCSYCAFKDKCWPGVRTFLYSNGPVFLTEVVKVPNVAEVEQV